MCKIEKNSNFLSENNVLTKTQKLLNKNFKLISKKYNGKYGFFLHLILDNKNMLYEFTKDEFGIYNIEIKGLRLNPDIILLLLEKNKFLKKLKLKNCFLIKDDKKKISKKKYPFSKTLSLKKKFKLKKLIIIDSHIEHQSYYFLNHLQSDKLVLNNVLNAHQYKEKNFLLNRNLDIFDFLKNCKYFNSDLQNHIIFTPNNTIQYLKIQTKYSCHTTNINMMTRFYNMLNHLPSLKKVKIPYFLKDYIKEDLYKNVKFVYYE